jgi:hypothetical protein
MRRRCARRQRRAPSAASRACALQHLSPEARRRKEVSAARRGNVRALPRRSTTTPTQQRTNLDRGATGGGIAGCPFQRGIQIRYVNDGEADEKFFRLGIGTIWTCRFPSRTETVVAVCGDCNPAPPTKPPAARRDSPRPTCSTTPSCQRWTTGCLGPHLGRDRRRSQRCPFSSESGRHGNYDFQCEARHRWE